MVQLQITTKLACSANYYADNINLALVRILSPKICALLWRRQMSKGKTIKNDLENLLRAYKIILRMFGN